MPILSIVRLNIAVSGMNNCLPASLAMGGGAGNSGARRACSHHVCAEYYAPF